MIEDGKAPRITQPEEGATYDPLLKKDKVEVSVSILLCQMILVIQKLETTINFACIQHPSSGVNQIHVIVVMWSHTRHPMCSWNTVVCAHVLFF